MGGRGDGYCTVLYCTVLGVTVKYVCNVSGESSFL